MTLVSEYKAIENTGITPFNLTRLRDKGEIYYTTSPEGYYYLMEEISQITASKPELKKKRWKRKKYTVIDLFAGIGGMRLGLSQAFGNRAEFVFSNEIDKYASQTYETNFGESPLGDITKINPKDIDDFDILMAGFPCQAFSIAGRKEGFEDKLGRGNLFFYIADILETKRPTSFLLENVKHFENHDKGNTFKTIKKTLTDKLGYSIYHKVLNSKDFDVAQNRPRIFIVGFDGDVPFEFPEPNTDKLKIKNFLEKNVPAKYYISQQYLNTLKAHKKRHKDAGHGFGYEVLNPEGTAYTLVCGGMGLERNMIKNSVLSGFYKKKGDDLKLKNKEGIRKLTPRECARLQGFPESFVIPVANVRAYKQFANAVSVPVIKAISKQILNVLDSN